MTGNVVCFRLWIWLAVLVIHAALSFGGDHGRERGMRDGMAGDGGRPGRNGDGGRPGRNGDGGRLGRNGDGGRPGRNGDGMTRGGGSHGDNRDDRRGSSMAGGGGPPSGNRRDSRKADHEDYRGGPGGLSDWMRGRDRYDDRWGGDMDDRWGGDMDDRWDGGSKDDNLISSCLCNSGLCDCSMEKQPGICRKPCKGPAGKGCCPDEPEEKDARKQTGVPIYYVFAALPVFVLVCVCICFAMFKKADPEDVDEGLPEENPAKGDEVFSITGTDMPTTSSGVPSSVLPPPPPYEPTLAQQSEMAGNDEKDLPPPYDAVM